VKTIGCINRRTDWIVDLQRIRASGKIRQWKSDVAARPTARSGDIALCLITKGKAKVSGF